MGPACRVCGSTETGFFAAKDGFDYWRCADCAFVYLEPMPGAAALARQYADDEAIGEDAYPKARSRFRRARIKAARFVRHLRGKDAVDLGCGGGFMVEAMRLWGARATGIDANPTAIAYAAKRFPKNRYLCEDLGDFRRRDTTFDFVYSSEVIEHLPDINGFMELVSEITRPAGWVYVTTPDIGHWRVPDDVTTWDVFTPPVHVQFFTAASIRILFERYGFRVRRKFFKLKPGLQILAQRNAIGDMIDPPPPVEGLGAR